MSNPNWIDLALFARRCLSKRSRLKSWDISHDDRDDIVSETIARSLEKSPTEDKAKRVVAGCLRGVMRDYWQERIAEQDRIDKHVLVDDTMASPTPDPWIDYRDGLAWLALVRLSGSSSDTVKRILSQPQLLDSEHEASAGLSKGAWNHRCKSLRRQALPSYVHAVLSECIDEARR